MSVKIGNLAPDFEADTTEGRIRFHDWIGDSWAVLFSYPNDCAPVCTAELVHTASIKPEFDRRGAKIIGLSVDPIGKHPDWAREIEQIHGTSLDYPIIGDGDLKVSKLYGTVPANVTADPGTPASAETQTVRSVFVIGLNKRVKLILGYPTTTARNLDVVLRVIELLQITAGDSVIDQVGTPGLLGAGDPSR